MSSSTNTTSAPVLARTPVLRATFRPCGTRSADTARRGAPPARVSPLRLPRRRPPAPPRPPPLPVARSSRAPPRGRADAPRVGITIEAGGASASGDRLIGPDSLGLQPVCAVAPGRRWAATLGSSAGGPLPAQPLSQTGGEERVVDDLLWLVRERLGEPAELLTRSSERARPRREPRSACCAAGSTPTRSSAPCVSAWLAWCTRTTCSPPSAGARSPPRAPPARGSCCTCTSTGSCARSACASRTARNARAATARNTLPGVRLNCRGSRPEAAAYAASLALWQRRMVGQADAIVVPSAVRARAPARARRAAPTGSACTCSRRPCARSTYSRRPPPESPPSCPPTRSSSRAWRPRRASTLRSTPAVPPASRWSSPATDPSAARSKHMPPPAAALPEPPCASPGMSMTPS